MQLLKWLDKIPGWTKISEWVETDGTQEDKEFMSYLRIHYNTDKTRMTFRYGIVSTHETTAKGISVWDDFDGRLRECRGVTFDTVNREVVTYPFDKFFELNQIEETSLENVAKAIESAECVEWSEKMDGSLMSLRWYNDTLEQTSMSRNESSFIEYTKKWLTDDIINLCQFNSDKTFIFEVIEDKNEHVVKYDTTDCGFYMLSYRDMTTGKLATYTESVALAKQYYVRHTPTYQNQTLQGILEELKTTTGLKREGVVVNVDGRHIKLKTSDYNELLRLRNGIGINELIQRVADGTISEVEEYLSKKNQEKLRVIRGYCGKIEQEVKAKAEDMPQDRKEFFTEWLPKQEECLRNYLTTYYLQGIVEPLKRRQAYVTWQMIQDVMVETD